MKKFISAIIKPAIAFSTSVFPFIFIFYLSLFLLENIFPGFVTNILDLNYLLIPIIIFGFLSAFTSDKTQEDTPVTKSDYMLITFLTITAFIILFYKTQDQGLNGIIISFIVAITTCFVAIILLKPDTENEDTDYKQSSSSSALKTHHNLGRQIIKYKIAYMFSGLLFICAVVVLIIYFKPQQYLFNQNTKIVKPPVTALIPVPTIEQHFFFDEISDVSFDPDSVGKTPITIMNAGVSSASLSAFIRLLQKNNFTINKIISANAYASDSAVVRFKPEDLDSALFLINIIKEYYSDINTAPLPPENNMIMVELGKK